MGCRAGKSEALKKMTPVETGVREYCANTREKVTAAVMVN
jgi:hypothetical protein